VALGQKTGGRRKGTPNKRTQQVAEVLRELDCDPIRGMAKIAANKRHPIELRAKMYIELARYVYPKRKAVDGFHEGTDEPFKFTLNIGDRGKGDALPESGVSQR
jgi:hypothetical protein